MLWKYCAYLLVWMTSGILGAGCYELVAGRFQTSVVCLGVATLTGMLFLACRAQYEKFALYLRTPEAASVPFRDSELEKASVPFMITRDMHQQLADLGFSKAEREAMTPDEAQRILRSFNV